MSVSFTAVEAVDFPMQVVIRADHYTDKTLEDGTTGDVALAMMNIVLFDDSDALKDYEDAQTAADDAWVNPDYTDGYTLQIRTLITLHGTYGGYRQHGVCISGTSPETEDPETEEGAGDGLPFSSCAMHQVDSSVTSYY
jgi:hypothetical protein